VVLQRHPGRRISIDHGPVLAQPVPALHGPAYPLLAGHLQEAPLDEQGDLPVHGHLRHVGQAGAQPCGAELPPARQGVDDPQADRVQEQVNGVHGPNYFIADTIIKIETKGQEEPCETSPGGSCP
jgi:hypothetical protein